MSKRVNNKSKTTGKVIKNKKPQKKSKITSPRRLVGTVDNTDKNSVTFSDVKRGARSLRMSTGRSLQSKTHSTFTLRGANGKRHIGSLQGDGVNITYDIQGAANVTIRYNKTKD